MFLFLLIIVIAFISQLIFPWWIIIPIAMISCALKGNSIVSAFLSSFIAIFILWLLMSIFLSFQNDHILANRVGEMLGLNLASYNWILVALISTLPGAITAGFAGASGYLLRIVLRNN
jgi:hypothetical protein